mgnify:CR=1 FL=1
MRKHLSFLLVCACVVAIFSSLTASSDTLTNPMRKALRDLRSNEPARAIKNLKKVNRSHPLKDYTPLLFARAYSQLGRYEKAEAALLSSTEGQLILPVEKDLLHAEILRGKGNLSEAIRAASSAYQSAHSSTEKTRALNLLASTNLELGNYDQALSHYIELIDKADLRFQGYQRENVFEHIEKCIRNAQSLPPNKQELFKYGTVLKQNGEWNRARDFFYHHLEAWTPPLKQKAMLEIGYLDGFLLDRLEEGMVMLNRLRRMELPRYLKDKVQYYRGSLLLREGETGEARKVLNRLLDRPYTNYWIRKAGDKIFRIHLEEGYSQGEKYLSELSAEEGLEKITVDSLWKLFFLAYREKRYGEAKRCLEKISSSFEGEDPKVVFWKYKVAQKLDQERSQFYELVEMAESNPFDYYSLLAQARGWTRGFSSTENCYAPRYSDREDMISHSLKILAGKASEKDLLDGAALFGSLGLYEPAIARLNRIDWHSLPPEAALLKSSWLASSGQYRKSIYSALEYRNRRSQQCALPVQAMKLSYPSYYQQSVEKSARKFDLPVDLIYSVIREESNFNHLAYSRSKAHGLMQIIPSTGRGIANQLKLEDYDTENIFEPKLNINMGTYYLSEQVHRFGSKRLGIAAYHGGPGQVSRWLDRFTGVSVDLWLELITSEATRGYVKRVYRNFLVYRTLPGN